MILMVGTPRKDYKQVSFHHAIQIIGMGFATCEKLWSLWGPVSEMTHEPLHHVVGPKFIGKLIVTLSLLFEVQLYLDRACPDQRIPDAFIWMVVILLTGWSLICLEVHHEPSSLKLKPKHIGVSTN